MLGDLATESRGNFFLIFLDALLSPRRLLGHNQFGHLDNLVNLLDGENAFPEARVVGCEVNLLHPVCLGDERDLGKLAKSLHDVLHVHLECRLGATSLFGLSSEFVDQLEIVRTLFHCECIEDALPKGRGTGSRNLEVLA